MTIKNLDDDLPKELTVANFLTLTAAGLTINMIANRTGVEYKHAKAMSESIPMASKLWARHQGKQVRREKNIADNPVVQKMSEKDIAALYVRHGGARAYMGRGAA